MPDAFDPEATRTRLLGGQLGLDHGVAAMRECVQTMPDNLGRWGSGINEVANAVAVGLGEDPRVREMTSIVIAMVTPAKLAQEDSPYHLASGWMTLALAHWFATGAHETAMFAHAFRADVAYYDGQYGTKSKARVDSASRVAALGVLGECWTELATWMQKPQLAPYREIAPAKVRTALDLASVYLRRAALEGDAIVSASERMLRHQIAPALERGGYGDAALWACLGGIAMPRARDYVSYLAPKPVKVAKPRATTAKKPAGPALPLPPTTTLPRIVASSSALASKEPWLAADDGWALRSNAMTARDDPRFRDVVELHTQVIELVTAPELRRLARATLDGGMLADLAERPQPSTIEVAFPRQVLGNSIDRGTIQVSPRLTRGVWRPVLAVGSLVNLRALSFDAKESDKARVARGAEPYAIAPAWFWESPLAARLEALDVEAELHSLGTWCAQFRALPRLATVYLRMWADYPGTYARPLRVVLERDGAAVKLTFQTMLSLDGYAEQALATLFAGTSPADFSTANYEQLGQSDGTADALATYATVGDVSGNRTLREL